MIHVLTPLVGRLGLFDSRRRPYIQLYRSSISLARKHTARVPLAVSSVPNPTPEGAGSKQEPALKPQKSSSQEPNKSESRLEVEEALKKAQEAVIEAESVIERIDTLPSARLPTLIDAMVNIVKPALTLSAVLGYCFITHALNPLSQILGGFFLAVAVAVRGYQQFSLSPTGALAAVAVGWGTLASSFRSGLVLLAFFFVSSALTKFGEENKNVEDEHQKGGQRNWIQVLSNGGLPALLSVGAATHSGGLDWALLPFSAHPGYSFLISMFLGYFACCCGDTWASEVGQLSTAEPRLITSLRPVRKGTNGGVTLLGLAASVAGGVFIGLVFYASGIVSPSFVGPRRVAIQQWVCVLAGAGAGLLGSLLDSVLGATIQFTGYNRNTGKITGKNGPDVSPISGIPVLDNNGVNVVSATVTGLSLALFMMIVF